MTTPGNLSNLAEIVRFWSAAAPDDCALSFDGRETTFGELNRHADRVAQGLIGEGAVPGTRVALIGKNSDAFFEILFGATKCGAVQVAVNWRLSGSEIQYIVDDCQAEILFVGADFTEIVGEILDDLKTVRRVIALDGGHDAWEAYGSWRDRQPAEDPGVRTAPEDVAVQMYSSGTTGLPKGAQITNDNFCREIDAVAAKLDNWQQSDVNLVVMPLFHIAGSLWGVYGLYHGCRNVIMPDVDPAAILETIAAEGITQILLVPAVILFMLQTPGCEKTDFSTVKEVIYGASPISQDVLQRAQTIFACDFGQLYGLTETTGAVTYLPPADHVPGSRRLLSCGKPLPTIHIRVVDDSGVDTPAGTVGEVIVRSPTNMKGYWNLPEETAAALRDGWFYTGDAGYLDDDGYLYIHDRVKDMIISGAENIYPAEVENALFEHPAVADAGVIGIPDEEWGETVMAFIVQKPDTEVTADDLIAHARDRIAHFKVPKTIKFVDALPRNPSGKVLKRELRKPYWEGRDRLVV